VIVAPKDMLKYCWQGRNDLSKAIFNGIIQFMKP
jgi:hypothetical protein